MLSVTTTDPLETIPMRRHLIACIVAAIAVVALPAAASAATVNIQNGHLQFNAAAGETNAVSFDATDDFLVVSDAKALITPGPGCIKQAPAHAVACLPPNPTPPADVIQAELGDRSDTLTVTPDMPLRVVAHGAEGDDVLRGGAHDDQLFGGGGNDTLDGAGGQDDMFGGDGADTADYSTRVNDLRVALGDDGDGEAGEHDIVEMDVENVLGGAGDDTLVGSVASNLLAGHGGDDVLQGLQGTDVLDGGAGFNQADYEERSAPVKVTLDGVNNDGVQGENDKLASIQGARGGSGANTLVGNNNPNSLIGGDSADTIRSLGGRDTILALGGIDTVDGGAGPDFIVADDGLADHITCDSFDLLNVDAIDIKTGC
jgi:Ca2+-binding RTX toxin-like protein